MKIVTITRLIRQSFNIAGSETLGFEEIDDPDSPYYGRVPIPKVLDAQLDELWMSKMSILRKQTLKELDKMILPGKSRKENWYNIFLTTLILLYNMEVIYQNQHEQRERYQTHVGWP